MKCAKAALPNLSTKARNKTDVLTGLAYVDGKVYVASLSNEEFSSQFRVIPFPFADGQGASVEIFHGSHGRVGNQFADPQLHALRDRRQRQPAGRIHLHAAGQDSAQRPEAGREGQGHDRGRAGQPQYARSTWSSTTRAARTTC